MAGARSLPFLQFLYREPTESSNNVLGYVRPEAKPSTSPRSERPFAMLVWLLLSLRTARLDMSGHDGLGLGCRTPRAYTIWDQD